MHRRKASLVIAAAGLTIASAGLAGVLPAVASPPAPAEPAVTTVIDTNFAGYLTGGNWRFRYVAADVPMAACRAAANQNAVAGIALKSNIFSEIAHIDLRCGGGHGSVTFGAAPKAAGHFQLSPSVGDVLRVSVFRNVAACRDEFTAINTRTGNTKRVTVRTPCQGLQHPAEGNQLTGPSVSAARHALRPRRARHAGLLPAAHGSARISCFLHKRTLHAGFISAPYCLPNGR